MIDVHEARRISAERAVRRKSLHEADLDKIVRTAADRGETFVRLIKCALNRGDIELLVEKGFTVSFAPHDPLVTISWWLPGQSE